MEDTIVGIATALGESAINIIRISGENAISITNEVFSRDLSNAKTHQVYYGKILDEKNEILDEVIVLIFKSPKSYTLENLVEIQCHGGSFVTKKILELLLSKGARLASHGEFTKRAFINGRIDLSKAEAIMDVINAKTELSLSIANKALNGEIYELVSNLQSELMDIISVIEVNIDYPEYDDVEILTNEILVPRIKNLIDKMNVIYEKSKTGKLIRNGINIAIIGKPNVGKSSLLNKLLDEEIAIVTDIPGTTRDKILGSLNINGVLVNLIDTAGIHQTDDVVEKIGVNKAIELVNDADIVILILDSSKKISLEDQMLLDLIKDKIHIIVLNKIDLKQEIEFEDGLKISIKENIGINELRNLIYEKSGLNEFNKDIDFLTNVRQINLLKNAIDDLNECLNDLKNNIIIDICEINLKNAWINLGEILGRVAKEDLLDEIFKRFCLGK